MALNVSPQPDGRIPVDAWDSLNGFGQWMKTYGDAIYGTRICAPYQSGTLSFTQKGDSVYVFRLYPTVQESVEAEIFVSRIQKRRFLRSAWWRMGKRLLSEKWKADFASPFRQDTEEAQHRLRWCLR